ISSRNSRRSSPGASGEVEFRHVVGRVFSGESRESGVEDRVLHDLVAGHVILVPASAPVGQDDVGFVAPDEVVRGKLRFLAGTNLSVGVVEKFGLRAEQAGGALRGFTLESPVSRRRNSGGTPPAQGQAQKNALTSEPDGESHRGAPG